MEPVNEELDAALLERPDDEAAWRVYADWLEERGDPRGEMIRAHGNPGRTDVLAAKHWHVWFGDLGRGAAWFDWRFGFVDRAVWGQAPSKTQWDRVLQRRAMAFLRTLEWTVTAVQLQQVDKAWATPLRALKTLKVWAREVDGVAARVLRFGGLGRLEVLGLSVRRADLGAVMGARERLSAFEGKLELQVPLEVLESQREVLREAFPRALLSPTGHGLDLFVQAEPKWAHTPMPIRWAELPEVDLRRCGGCASESTEPVYAGWYREAPEPDVVSQHPVSQLTLEYRCRECGRFTSFRQLILE